MPSTPSGQSLFRAYSIALGSAAGALIFGRVLLPYLDDNAAYLIFLAATALAARAGGFAPSMVTLGLGFFAVHWFFIRPPHRLHLGTTRDWINTLGYLFVGLALGWFGRRFHSSACSFSKREREGAEAERLRSATVCGAIAAASSLDQASLPKEPEPEMELARCKRALVETARQLDEFVYAVSHDLRSPLRAIKGFTIALCEDHDRFFNEEGKNYARRIVNATERLEQMLAALLAYSRLGRGEVTLMKVELEKFLGKPGQRWAAQAGAKGGQLEIVGALPAVVANPLLLEQALDQIVSNAIKFTAPGTVPRVKLQIRQVGNNVRIEVLDNGIGIEPKHFSKLFQVFQRFGPSDTYPGIGVGLALVRRATEKMGGTLGAESKPGEGTCLWIELPRFVSDDAAVATL